MLELPRKFLPRIKVGSHAPGMYVDSAEFDCYLPKLEEVRNKKKKKNCFCFTYFLCFLISQVFKAFPNTPINLEVKNDDEICILKTQALVEKYNRRDKTIWGSFKDEGIQIQSKKKWIFLTQNHKKYV